MLAGFRKIAKYLELVRLFRDVISLVSFMASMQLAVVIIDDKLMASAQVLNALLVPESSIRYRHHERLMLVADNLANYFRVLLRDKPERFWEERVRFEK